ncbi:MAG: LytTR family DNA-binding domain-containing protein [Bacteroidota bacterium]
MSYSNSPRIRAVLIDDEASARQLLSQLLDSSPFPVEIVGEADDVASGCQLVKKVQPDLIFLDIHLKQGTGFDLLNCLDGVRTEVIFVTAYSEYAVRAFDFAALGYLLKPLRITDLHDALRRFSERRNLPATADRRIKTFMENRSGKLNRMVVPDVSGFRVLDPKQIIYLRGEINYTRFFLADGGELLSSKTLKEYEKMLTDSGFCRVHQSYLINLSHVTSYQRGEGGVVCLDNGHHLDVSRRRKAEFVRCFVG